MVVKHKIGVRTLEDIDLGEVELNLVYEDFSRNCTPAEKIRMGVEALRELGEAEYYAQWAIEVGTRRDVLVYEDEQDGGSPLNP